MLKNAFPFKKSQGYDIISKTSNYDLTILFHGHLK
jgi:hypothetical protein